MYSTVKMQSVRDLDLGLEDIIGMVKTIFINHSERSWVPKGVRSRTVKFGGAVVSQEQTICVSPP